MRGFVLAAGLGTRLRPLTDFVPKPMVRVADVPLVERAVRQLVAAGVTEIGINLFYKPEQIIAHFGDGSRFGAEITWFDERLAKATSGGREPLGTGGGLKFAEAFLNGGGERFVLINGDAWHTFDVAGVVAAHRPGDIATWVVHVDRRRPALHTVDCLENGQVRGIAARPPYNLDELAIPGGFRAIYTGVAVYECRLLQRLPAERISGLVTHAIAPALHEGERMGWHRADGLWIDCGTIAELQRADVFARSIRHLEPAALTSLRQA